MLATVEPRTLAHSRVYGARTDTTAPATMPHAVHVSTETDWPHAVFMAWLDQLREARKIPSDMQLAVKAGISSPSVISGWRSGRTQPSRENLRKIAKLAGEPPIRVFRLAGVVDAEDLDGPELVPDSPTPRQIQELIDLYWRSDEDTQTVILGQVDFLVHAMSKR